MTRMSDEFINKRLRIAGIMIAIGLIVEAFSLIWNHPLSFVAFLGIGGLLLFLGIVLYLAALVSPRQS
jgi:hydrogenase/urease accessory protein HupE